jgi:hypothetical protein
VAGLVTIQGSVTQVPQGQITVGPLTLTPTSSNQYSSSNLILSSGANTITVPTWATHIIIEPDPANTVSITLKGVTGDTGIPLALNQASVFSIPGAGSPGTIVLTSGAGATLYTNIVFF